MSVSKRRCNQCREYVHAESMIKLGSVWVCSEVCQEAKLSGSKQKDKKSQSDQPNKAAVRQKVIERDGERCLVCRASNVPLHLHRIVYGSHGGKYEISNTCLLCYHHHNADGRQSVHSRKKEAQPLLLAHLAGDTRAAGKLRKLLLSG